MVGRAGHARGWLAVEHSGPWGRNIVADVLSDPLRDVDLDGIRVVLIRRRATRAPSDGPCTVFMAWGAGARPWIRQVTVSRLDDLAQLVPLIREAEPAVGAVPQLPVVLVCTHGKRDACCAEFGRPVHRAVKDRTDADVWECTHVGGDRFAANMVILPEALYFSRLTPATADAPIDGYLQGRLDMPTYRGRASLSMAEQAAEHAARVATGADALGAVEIIRRVDTAEGPRVSLSCAGQRYDADLREAPVADGGVMHACDHLDRPQQWTSWTSARLRPLVEDPPQH